MRKGPDLVILSSKYREIESDKEHGIIETHEAEEQMREIASKIYLILEHETKRS